MSGCQAEGARLRTAERLTNLLAVLCVVGWRVFWLTMANRATPEAPPEVAVTRAEVEILDRLAGATSPPPKPAEAHYLLAIAKLVRLSGAVEGPAAGEYGDLARADPAHGYPPRI
jgi:hypothetical protein